MRISRRRLCLGLLALGSCSGSAPDQAEALDQIAKRLRQSFAQSERLENLAWLRGVELEGGRYAVFVDYDMVSTMPEIGLFNTQIKTGERSHVVAERYVFVRSSTGWALE